MNYLSLIILSSSLLLSACQEQTQFFDKSVDTKKAPLSGKKKEGKKPSPGSGPGSEGLADNETLKPGSGTTQINNDTNRPGPETSRTDNESSKPGSDSRNPESGPVKPGTGTSSDVTNSDTESTSTSTTTTTSSTTTTNNNPRVPGQNHVNEGPKFQIIATAENFKQLEKKVNALDILWVVDNSGSMADEQAAVARNFNTFIDNFQTDNIDFKMAITTTDSRELWRGLVVKGSMETLTSEASKKDHAAFINNFKSKIMVGTKGNGVEHGLAAITNFIDVHGSNFLREDAYFIVILVSDEDDQSPMKVTDYATELIRSKKDSRNIKVFSIVDVKAKSVTEGTLVKGHARYKEFSDLTKGQVLDIRQDFGKSLKFIGESVNELMNNFKLSHIPEEGSVKITVNGEVVASSNYKLSENIVIFQKGFEPANGASIKIEYTYKKKI